MVVYGRCTIDKENNEWYDVAHYGSVAVFLESFGGIFAINVSTLEQYIPNATLDSH